MKKPSFLKKFNLPGFRRTIQTKGMVFVLGLLANSAFASGTGGTLPFVSVLTTLSNAISGPLAMSVATILIVATGLMNAFGEWGDGMKKLINVGFWLAIVFGVLAVLNTFGGTGAIV